MKYNIKEEIARSHQTINNDPFQYDDNENVKVEMYANDKGTWSVKVDCTSNPSLSHPLRKFPDEASANHYARQACDRIIRQTMNERFEIKKYSLVEQIYDKNNEVLNEGLLDWFFGLMGKFINEFFNQVSEVEKGMSTTLNPKLEDKSVFGKWANKILGKTPDVKSAKELDMSDEKNRKVFMSCVCDDTSGEWKISRDKYQSHFENLLKIEQWFPPEDEEEAKKWGKGPGKVISEGLYGYLGKQGFMVKYIGETLGGDAKTAGDAYEGIKKDKGTMGSALKTAQFIKDTINPALTKIYKYSLEKLDVEGVKNPMETVTLGNKMLEKLIPLLEKASKKKAEEAPKSTSGEPEASDVDSEDKDKKKTEARVRHLVSNILLEMHS